MRWKKTWQVSILIKMILILLAVVIPLYALSIVINKWGAARIGEEISESVMSKVHFYLNSLEAEISRIKYRQSEYLSDYSLHLLSISVNSGMDYSIVKAVRDVQDKLRVMANTSAYIKTVRAHLPSLKKTISVDALFDDIPYDEFSSLTDLYKKSGSPLLYLESRVFLMVGYPTYLPEGRKDHNIVVDTELSLTELEKALQQFSSYAGDSYILMCPESGWSISSNKDSEIIENGRQVLASAGKDGVLNGIRKEIIGKKKYIVAFDTSDYLNMALLAYIPEEAAMGHAKNYQVWFWVLSIISVSIMIMFSYSIYRMIYKPLQKLVGSFHKVDEGDLEISIRHNANDEFEYLFGRFNVMVDKLKKLIHEVYQEKILAQNAELKQLQSQISPHFLYNSFYLLHRMIKSNDNENASCFSQQLGKYFEFITRNASNEVTLDAEMKHAKTYVEIQAMRFSNRVSVEFDDLPQNYAKLPVPRLILQPIIENAFEHGIKNRVKDGKILVKVAKTDKGLCISVQDNGDHISDITLQKLKKELSSDSRDIENTGMINVHRRLKLKFGRESGLRVSRGQLGGLQVDMMICVKEDDVCSG